MTESIENRTFDEIQIGDAASVTRALRPEDVETWAAVTGNLNLIDLDPTSLDSSMFPSPDRHPGRRRCSRLWPTRGYPASDRSLFPPTSIFSSRCRSARR